MGFRHEAVPLVAIRHLLLGLQRVDLAVPERLHALVVDHAFWARFGSRLKPFWAAKSGTRIALSWGEAAKVAYV